MAKQYKIDLVSDLSKDLKDQGFVFVNYDGVSADDIYDIRNEIREIGGSVKVIKNSLLKRAVKSLYKDLDEEANDLFIGMTALVSIDNDSFMSCAKVLQNKEKEEKISIKGGVYQNGQVDSKYIHQLASVPSKDELYSTLVGSLQGIVAGLVYVLDDVKKTKEN